MIYTKTKRRPKKNNMQKELKTESLADIITEAYEAGYKKGYKAGLNFFKSEMEKDKIKYLGKDYKKLKK